MPRKQLSLQGNPTVQGDFVPAFAGLEGKVLRFEAFTTEQVPENLTQPSRVRKFTICYHLVDDSIQVRMVCLCNGLPRGFRQLKYYELSANLIDQWTSRAKQRICARTLYEAPPGCQARPQRRGPIPPQQHAAFTADYRLRSHNKGMCCYLINIQNTNKTVVGAIPITSPALWP